MWWKRRYRPQPEERLNKRWEQLSFEKGDLPALLIAALITLLPAVLLVGGVFLFVIWVLFL